MEEMFYGHMFKDREISAVYVYDKPVDADNLELQVEEVESVMWISLEECEEAVEKGTIPNCIYMDELMIVKDYLEKLATIQNL